MSAGGEAVVVALVVLGLLVVLPLGLRLLGPGVVPAPRSPLWVLAGGAGAASLVVPRGSLAVALAACFAVATTVLVVAAVRLAVLATSSGAWVEQLPAAARAATVVGLVMPAVGAAALVAERGGWGLLGFGGTYLALTVPHMLYAGFGAALVAGSVTALARRDGGPDALAVAGAWGVPIGTGLVLVGYFVNDVAELVGALVLAGALWATAGATARSLVRDRALPPAGRALLAVGAVAGAGALLLAVWWAAGEALEVPHPGLELMAATHGVANALGFVLCSLLATRRLRSDAGPGWAGRGVAPRRTSTRADATTDVRADGTPQATAEVAPRGRSGDVPPPGEETA